MPDALAFAFTLVAEGTDAEGAELRAGGRPRRRRLPRVRDRERTARRSRCACAACGSLDVELVRGEELLVDADSTMGRSGRAVGRSRGGRHPLDLGGDELRRRLVSRSRRRASRASRTSCSARSRGIPKVNLHNKVLSPDARRRGVPDAVPGGRPRRARRCRSCSSIEGSIPNENINGDGYWTSFGNDEATGEPLTLNWWIDQLAPKAWGVVAIGTCATYGGIHAMAGNPTGCMGLADYLGWDFRSAGGLPIVNVPGCPVQPENFMETLVWLLYQAAGLAPVIPLDDQLRPTVDLRQDRPRGLRPRGLLRAGRLRRTTTTRPSAW